MHGISFPVNMVHFRSKKSVHKYRKSARPSRHSMLLAVGTCALVVVVVFFSFFFSFGFFGFYFFGLFLVVSSCLVFFFSFFFFRIIYAQFRKSNLCEIKRT